MPAFRPTAGCIWNSFRSSGKHHLILTGNRGSGKSTLLKALFPQPLPGITTWAEPKKAVWLKENRTSRCAQVGCYDNNLPGAENKMTLCPDGFLELGISAIKACVEQTEEWVTLDEIGYLETQCPEYCHWIRRLLSCKRVALVLRKQDTALFRELTGREDAFIVDLDAPYGSLGCVIMASGLGKRFGGNKLLADFLGEPLLFRVLAATEGIFQSRVVVTRHEEIAALCREKGIETVLHQLPFRSDTVRLGLEAVGAVDGCLFCPGDQPLLRRETVAALVLAGCNDPGSIWRTCFQDTPGSPVLFPKWSFPELQELPEGKGGGYVAKKHPERLRMVSVRDEYELMDVDSPEEYQFLLERLEQCSFL